MPEWLPYLVTAVIGLLFGAAAWLLKVAWPVVRKLNHFVDDVVGEPDRPGVPGRPGLMERVAHIEHEVKTNHGSSLKDAVKRIEVTSEETSAKLTEHIKISKEYDAEQLKTADRVERLAAKWADAE